MSELKTVYLKDYAPPAYLVEQVELHVELDPTATRVRSRLQLAANPAAGPPCGVLRLDGRQLELLEIALEGMPLTAAAYAVDTEGLTITGVPERFLLESTVRIDPEGNTALEGLYRASGIFCTQCEAQGFRKITFYPDRPDVMAHFTTTVIGDRALCPVLLANGNLTASGSLDGNRHFATFVDPFPKPSYLFALVAGPLAAIEDRFTTASGREVRLQIFVEARNRDRCGHAMASLKNAMRWDEATYGLEYDLDEYMIVAVDDFNMGAMENKGLNVFNSKYVLARPGDRHRCRLPGDRGGDRPRVLPQLDRQPGHLPRLVPVESQGRADRLPRPGVFRRHGFARRSSASRTCACCATASSPRTPARWPTRCARSPTSRSTTSTRPRSTTRAPR